MGKHFINDSKMTQNSYQDFFPIYFVMLPVSIHLLQVIQKAHNVQHNLVVNEFGSVLYCTQ